ncbi:MAG: hypothetical protein HYV03_02675, partial [Deltaproteobacteria bacterium]|nr:hypothetical protein [Deltaproteobacteria bacterium]
LTGASYPEATADGSYYLRGITPGRKYAVEYGEVNPAFVNESSVGPYGDEQRINGEMPRSGFGKGAITAGSGKFTEVACEEGGKTIVMDTVTLPVEAGGTPPKASQITPPPEPPAKAEKAGGCSLLP